MVPAAIATPKMTGTRMAVRCTWDEPNLFRPVMVVDMAVADEGDVVITIVKGEPFGTDGIVLEDCVERGEFEAD